MGAILDAALEKETVKTQFLAEVTAGREYTFFEQVSAAAGGYQLTWTGTTGNSQGYVAASDSASLNMTGSMTLEVWLKYGANEHAGLIGKGPAFGSYSLLVASRPFFRLNQAGMDLSAHGHDLLVGETYHIAGVYDKTAGKARIFINGALVAEANYAEAVGTCSDPLIVGNYWDRNWGLTASSIQGVRISSVARYSTTFTPEATWTDDADTVLLWNLTSNTFPISDESSNGNDGTASATSAPVFEAIGTEVTHYRTAESIEPVAVYANGVALTKVADVTTTEGWSWDGTYVNLHLAGWDTPYNYVVLGMIPFYFSTEGKMFPDVNRAYEGRITEIPKLSGRVEAEFNGVGQVGSSTLSLSNADGFFDDLSGLSWKAGSTTFLVGADLPAAGGAAEYVMPYSEYVAMATWVNASTSKTNKKFTLTLNEGKNRLKKKIPYETYTRYEYSNLEESGIGVPKQLAYGRIYGAKPVCIDVDAKRFKLADHAIHSIMDVRVASSENAQSVSITSYLSLGEFVLDTWDGTSSVAVDFKGKTKTNGRLMDNLSDIYADILTYMGETNQNASSFAAAKAALTVGYYGPDTENIASVRCPSIYLDTQTDAFELFSKLNAACFTYLFCNASGEYELKVFKPVPGDGLPVFTDSDIVDGSFEERNEEATEYSTASVNYGERLSEGWSQVASYTVARNQYLKNEPVPVAYEGETVPLSDTQDALYWLERTLTHLGTPPKKTSIAVKRRGLTIKQGDAVVIQYDRHGINAVYEVLEVDKDPKGSKGPTVKLTLGNMHGFENRVGFWVSTSKALPTSLELETGYGAGTVTWDPSWSEAIKAWATQNMGYWTNPAGFVNAADKDSKNISVWI